MSSVLTMPRTEQKANASLATVALRTVVEHWGDPHGFSFSVEAIDECAEVRVIDKRRRPDRAPRQRAPICDLAVTTTALDPDICGDALAREVVRRRRQLDADLLAA